MLHHYNWTWPLQLQGSSVKAQDIFMMHLFICTWTIYLQV